MVKIPVPKGIPLFGRTGLIFILGVIWGVIVDKLLQNFALSEGGGFLRQTLYQGFKLDDLIGLLIPIGLLVFIKRFKPFFVGWFCGQLATELYEWTQGIGGYTEAPF